MKFQSILLAAASAGLFAGCETIPPGAEPGPNGTIAYNVLIEASEPGAKVQVNNQVVGNTPLTLKVFGDKDGTFHDFGSFEYVVQALPVRTNQFAQTRVYHTGKMFGPEDRIPDRIYFDMNQPSQAYAPMAGPGGYPGPDPYYYPGPYFYGPRFYIGPRPYYRHHFRRW